MRRRSPPRAARGRRRSQTQSPPLACNRPRGPSSRSDRWWPWCRHSTEHRRQIQVDARVVEVNDPDTCLFLQPIRLALRRPEGWDWRRSRHRRAPVRLPIGCPLDSQRSADRCRRSPLAPAPARAEWPRGSCSCRSSRCRSGRHSRRAGRGSSHVFLRPRTGLPRSAGRTSEEATHHDPNGAASPAAVACSGRSNGP